MGKKDLQAFIAAKKKIEKTKEIDWGKKKDNWLEKLNKLYEDIESWLNDLEQDVVSIEYVDKDINEEHIGMYTAKKMTLRIADEQVVLDPVGTLLIGAAGRVDMIGKNGKVKFVVLPVQEFQVLLKRLEDASDLRTIQEAKSEPLYDQKEAEDYIFMNPVKRERLEKGWTQKELAEKLSVKQSSVAKWERDGAVYLKSTRKKLALVFGTSEDVFL